MPYCLLLRARSQIKYQTTNKEVRKQKEVKKLKERKQKERKPKEENSEEDVGHEKSKAGAATKGLGIDFMFFYFTC